MLLSTRVILIVGAVLSCLQCCKSPHPTLKPRSISNAHIAHARLIGIPTVPYNESTQGSRYQFKNLRSITVDQSFQDAVDSGGETLIPSTLRAFADTFSADLFSTLGLRVPVNVGYAALPNSVFLTLGDAEDYLDAAARQTSEGYTLQVDESGIILTGASPLGVWWGTRTVLQQAVLGDGIPYGSGTDAPGWRNRGLMVRKSSLFTKSRKEASTFQVLYGYSRHPGVF